MISVGGGGSQLQLTSSVVPVNAVPPCLQHPVFQGRHPPSTNWAGRCLTSVIWREPVCPAPRSRSHAYNITTYIPFSAAGSESSLREHHINRYHEWSCVTRSARWRTCMSIYMHVLPSLRKRRRQTDSDDQWLFTCNDSNIACKNLRLCYVCAIVHWILCSL